MKYFSKISCPLCNSNDYEIMFKSTLQKMDYSDKVLQLHLKNSLDDFTKHGRIVRCKMCMLVYVNPQENQKQILKAYGNVVDEEYLKTERFRKLLFKKHLNQLLKYRQSGRLLDIGCFCGFFLELAQKKRFKTYGIEPSLWASNEAKRRGVRIIGKSLNEIKKQKFDVITLFDVIEHLGNPKKELSKIHKALVRDGIMVIGTPNVESLTVKLLGSHHPFFIRMHVVLFGERTIARILENTGFTIKQITYYGRTYPLVYYMEKLSPLLPFSNYLIKLISIFPALAQLPITINFKDELLVIAQRN